MKQRTALRRRRLQHPRRYRAADETVLEVVTRCLREYPDPLKALIMGLLVRAGGQMAVRDWAHAVDRIDRETANTK